MNLHHLAAILCGAVLAGGDELDMSRYLPDDVGGAELVYFNREWFLCAMQPYSVPERPQQTPAGSETWSPLPMKGSIPWNSIVNRGPETRRGLLG